jgi:hypothetical protein
VSAVNRRKASPVVAARKFFAAIHKLFEKKCWGIKVLTEEESALLVKVQSSKLLRALIDPTIPFEFPSDYVPAMIELELCLTAITGHVNVDKLDVKQAVVQIAHALHGEEGKKMFKGI